MESSLSEFRRALARRGYRFTQARKEVLSALVLAGGHISANELVDLVRHGGSDVGRMTVYRTLDLLTELGLVRPIYQGTGAAHFVLLVEGHHHHLVCTGCDKVVELDVCLLTDIERRMKEDTDFEVRGHLLEIFGLCRQCRDATE
ncbi:MAG: transcriptional repressor [Chloroflexota bacterium]|nr:MAG: transcriptional repressor [Chloroflexota bacterium]